LVRVNVGGIVGFGVGVGVVVGFGVGVFVGIGDGLGVGVLVGLGVGVAVGGTGVGVKVGLEVGVAVNPGVRAEVGVGVAKARVGEGEATYPGCQELLVCSTIIPDGQILFGQPQTPPPRRLLLVRWIFVGLPEPEPHKPLNINCIPYIPGFISLPSI